jgi:pimeloyl-CoA synthetase
MSLADSKIILADVLDKKITDSLLIEYGKRDKYKSDIIDIQKFKINFLNDKVDNLNIMTNNYKTMIDDKDREVELLNWVIKKQEKEITKQKILKILGFSGAIILPITVLLLKH